MGRTKRKRLKKELANSSACLDHENCIINLRKFMARHGFKDEINLKLRNLPKTGRGVVCKKTLHPNDVIIRVPYNLMVTYSTVQSLNFPQLFKANTKLKMHDLLTVFLVIERHKKQSFWSSYIESLPPRPPWIPPLLSTAYIELLPVDLRLAAQKSRRLFQESWSRIRKSIKRDWTCSCCGKNTDCVLDLNTFTWGYILVNTRAVYVNPEIIRDLCDCSQDILSDEPCMALCPFLDMFNHSDKAKTRAELTYHEGQLVYQLTTFTPTNTYEQVFISYGSHDNVRLLVEYGFFIPGNVYDTVLIEYEQVLKVLKLHLTDFQYKFIRKHGLDKSSDLYINLDGPSFNLKACLFVSSCDNDTRNFAPVIYSDCYPKDFLNKMMYFCQKLLQSQLQHTEGILETCTNRGLDSKSETSLVIDFLKYKIEYVKILCDN